MLQDDNPETTYATKAAMRPGMWIETEFPHQRNVFKVILRAKGGDFAAFVKVEASEDGETWTTVADKVPGRRDTVVTFPMVVAREIRVTNLAEKGKWWQLFDVEIIGPGAGDIDQFPVASRHYLQVKDAVSVKTGWGETKQDRSVVGGELSIAGKRFENGLGTHAVREIVYDIAGKGYTHFYSMMGHGDSDFETDLAFRVLTDDVVAFDSGSMHRGDPPSARPSPSPTSRRSSSSSTSGMMASMTATMLFGATPALFDPSDALGRRAVWGRMIYHGDTETRRSEAARKDDCCC